MLLKKNIEYSLRILIYFSRAESNYYINANEIADTVKLPNKFVSKILQNLAKQKILFSRKGRNGGFKMRKSSDNISVGQIIDQLSNGSVFSECLLGIYKRCENNSCPLFDKWIQLKEHIFQSTISDLSKEII